MPACSRSLAGLLWFVARVNHGTEDDELLHVVPFAFVNSLKRPVVSMVLIKILTFVPDRPRERRAAVCLDRASGGFGGVACAAAGQRRRAEESHGPADVHGAARYDFLHNIIPVLWCNSSDSA